MEYNNISTIRYVLVAISWTSQHSLFVLISSLELPLDNLLMLHTPGLEICLDRCGNRLCCRLFGSFSGTDIVSPHDTRNNNEQG